LSNHIWRKTMAVVKRRRAGCGHAATSHLNETGALSLRCRVRGQTLTLICRLVTALIHAHTLLIESLFILDGLVGIC
jgi:hypothetical protein